jgi:predicted GNAT family acetyltransferase
MAVDMQVNELPEQSIFEITDADRRRVGIIDYYLRDGALVMTRAKVDPQVEGRGVGSALVQGALEQVRVSGRAVVPVCPFIAYFIDKHPEYTDLVAPPAV